MDQKPNFYAILTAAVRYSDKINDFAKLIFAEITALSNKNGYCTAKNETLGKWYNKNGRTVSRAISALSDAGFIYVELVKNSNGTFRRIYPEMDSKTVRQKRRAGTTKKSKPRTTNLSIHKNTIKDNTINNNIPYKEEIENEIQDLIDYDIKNEIEEEEKKKSCGKKEKINELLTQKSEMLQYQFALKEIKLAPGIKSGPEGMPPNWTDELKLAFLLYCDMMNNKKSGKWGYTRQITNHFEKIDGYSYKHAGSIIVDCLEYAADNSNTTYDPTFTINRLEKKKIKKKTGTASNYDAVRNQLLDPNFLKII
jgi:hypothetical protein